MSKVKAIEQLSKEDVAKLKYLRDNEIASFKKIVGERFDSKKNWSIMMNPRDNDTRNQIMQKVKFEQLKRRCLHDFMRKTREEILKEAKERRGRTAAATLNEEIADAK